MNLPVEDHAMREILAVLLVVAPAVALIIRVRQLWKSRHKPAVRLLEKLNAKKAK